MAALAKCLAIIAITFATISVSGNAVGIEIISAEYEATVTWNDPLFGNPVYGSISQSSSGEPITIEEINSAAAGGRISIDAFRMRLEQWSTIFESGNHAFGSVVGNSVWEFRPTDSQLVVDVQGEWSSERSYQEFGLILRDITLNNVLLDFEHSEFRGGLNESFVFDTDPTHVYELAMSTGAHFIDLGRPGFSHVIGDVRVTMASAVPEQASTGWLLAITVVGLLIARGKAVSG